jgi:hypothetical protein
MNTPEQPLDVPHQAPPESPGPPGNPGGRRRTSRRALTLLIIVLLIGIPAGYLIISANQSRDSGKDKDARYAINGLAAGVPSKVQRRLYDMPVPTQHQAASFYETNNWKTSRLYVQFLTTKKGLNAFLTTMGTSAHALKKNYFPISARDRKVADWDFTGSGHWQGLAHDQHAPLPSQQVVVNLANPQYPQVYVVSSTTP